MSRKFLIIAGILLSVFIVFLIVLAGGTGGDKIVSKSELETKLTSITCEVKNDTNTIDYDISTISNDVQFDSNLKIKDYSKITINKETNLKFLGVAFLVKTRENTTLNFSLTLNGTELKSTSISTKANEIGDVGLLLENEVDVNQSDELAISISQSGTAGFVFDTMIFFFDEV